MTREPPNRYSPPCVLRAAGGPPPSPPGRSRLEPGDGDTSCQGPSQPKPCLSGIFKGEPDPAVTNSHPPPTDCPSSRSLRLGPRGTNFRGGGAQNGGVISPPLPGEVRGGMGRKLGQVSVAQGSHAGCNRCAQSVVGALGGGAAHHRCPGCGPHSDCSSPRERAAEAPRSRSKFSCAGRGGRALSGHWVTRGHLPSGLAMLVIVY